LAGVAEQGMSQNLLTVEKPFVETEGAGVDDFDRIDLRKKWMDQVV
jgi:hypothetical protein